MSLMLFFLEVDVLEVLLKVFSFQFGTFRLGALGWINLDYFQVLFYQIRQNEFLPG